MAATTLVFDDADEVTASVTEISLPLAIAALMSAVAAGVHGTLAPLHAKEAGMLGVAFAAAAAFQLLCAGLLVLRPRRWVLEITAVGSTILILAWAMSRAIGLPIGSDPWTPEPVGVVDGLTVGFELGCLWLCFSLRSAPPPRSGARSNLAASCELVAVGALGLFLLLAAQADAHGEAVGGSRAGHLLHAALLGTAFVVVFLTRALIASASGRKARMTKRATRST